MKQRNPFDTVRVVGGLLPTDLLERIGGQDRDLDSIDPTDYQLAPGERLGEAITRSWNRLQPIWERFATRLDEPGEPLTGPTRQEWLLPLLHELGYGHLETAPGFEISGKAYPVSHMWQSVPVHLVGVGVDLDRRSAGVAGAATASPHGMIQELLNRSEEHLWGLVCNGRQLRMLRDNASLTRQAYVQFDLQAMFAGEVFSDFALLWLTAHASRLAGPAGKQVLETWRQDAAQQGVRARDALRDGVEAAIEALGSAAVGHPANVSLRERLAAKELDAQDLYRQVLRLVYRLLFLLVSESRGLLTLPNAPAANRRTYEEHYSITRLRNLAEELRGSAHTDLWQQLKVVAEALGSEGEPALALPALGGFLWSGDAIPDLDECTLTNEALLTAVRHLTTVRLNKIRHRVDYGNLGADELGSIYESLLEYVPEVNPVAGSFTLVGATGSERKSTGSYYTPTSLIEELLDSALDPVLDRAASSAYPEQAILALKIVDPASGSGHFLIAAAHRVADRLARLRLGGDEPSPEQMHRALRDAIAHCIYAVDINPMAVELAKVALWIEGMERGKPLTFLDHHIVCGNSLLGTTPELLEQGVPDKAFAALTGDDKEHVRVLRARNRKERKRGLAALTFGDAPDELLQLAATELKAIGDLSDDTLDAVREKQRRYEAHLASAERRRLRLAADAWVAAFVSPKTEDSPPITTSIVNSAIHDPDSIPHELAVHISDIAQRYSFHHWHLVFPQVFAGDVPNEQTGWAGGFDIVLGNPPWEQIQYDPQEAFADSHPTIAAASTMAKRNALVAELATTDPTRFNRHLSEMRKIEAVQHFAHGSGVYPLSSIGRLNTAPLFLEVARSTLSLTGRLGLIVPTAIASSSFNQKFFRDLLNTEQLVSLYDFFNRGFFPGAAGAQGNRFCLLTLSRRRHRTPEFLFLGEDVQELAEKNRRFTLTREDIDLLNPNTGTAPMFRSEKDARLTKLIYHKFGPLKVESQENNPWDVEFQLMFMMNAASDLFRTAEELEAFGAEREGIKWVLGNDCWLPLYEGKMTHQFTHRWGTYAGMVHTGKAVRQLRKPSNDQLTDPRFSVLPRYWVHRDEVEAKLANKERAWLLGFRDVTSPIDFRTVIAAVLPPYAVGHKVPLIHVQAPASLVACLVATLNAFAFDYVARQKLAGTSMAFFVMKQLPVPAPAHFDAFTPWEGARSLAAWVADRVLELTYTNHEITGFAADLDFDGPPFRWDDQRRDLLRAELDAAFFHLYGLDRQDTDYIMETFAIAKRKDIAEHGSYRTKELILDVYDRMTTAIATREPYVTPLSPPPAHPNLAVEV